MTSIEIRHVVACPYTLARAYLAGDVSGRALRKEAGRMTLHAPLAGADVSKNVVVTFAAGDDPMHFDEPWRVHWTPEGGGPYPDFDGQLTVRADEDYDTAILELRGEYVPPGGAVGAAFDRAVGSRIATATAKDLLTQIASGMESRYAADERSKKEA
ncbi:MAG: hypothetical protein JO199_00250 [Candidatus Eremiobacteraeota bacterium]|nr:hypothetical protein [Candidatus Eremiobacteraeota bacterium]